MPLKALPPPQETAVLKHIGGHGVQSPVVAFSGIAGLSWHFHEAVIERQVVPDRVLPRRELLAVVGKAAADELADLAKSKPLAGALQDCHGDERDV